MSKTKVLFLDDEERIVNSLRLIFAGKYQTFTATHARQAIALLLEHEIAVVVSDQRMPGVTGVEFLAEVKKISPASIRILLTGYADEQAISDSINKSEVFRYIQKPWKNEDLVAAIDKAALVYSQSASGVGIKLNIDLASLKTQLMVIAEDKTIQYNLRRLLKVDGLTHCQCHYAKDMTSALKILLSNPVGVVFADTEAGGAESAYLLKTLKKNYPQVITIAIRQELDPDQAIALINQGQIFRFIRKNASLRQWRFVLLSAIQQHTVLMENAQLLFRHQVEDDSQRVGDERRHENIATALKWFGRKLLGIKQ